MFCEITTKDFWLGERGSPRTSDLMKKFTAIGHTSQKISAERRRSLRQGLTLFGATFISIKCSFSAVEKCSVMQDNNIDLNGDA